MIFGNTSFFRMLTPFIVLMGWGNGSLYSFALRSQAKNEIRQIKFKLSQINPFEGIALSAMRGSSNNGFDRRTEPSNKMRVKNAIARLDPFDGKKKSIDSSRDESESPTCASCGTQWSVLDQKQAERSIRNLEELEGRIRGLGKHVTFHLNYFIKLCPLCYVKLIPVIFFSFKITHKPMILGQKSFHWILPDNQHFTSSTFHIDLAYICFRSLSFK